MLASPDSLLGQLQRGSGRGFLQALNDDPAIVIPHLLSCIIHDPRWDHQLESRSAYYSSLLHSLPTPLASLDAYLHTCNENDSHDSEELVLDTLCDLAFLGAPSAIPLLQAYLSYGYYWGSAFETLIEISSFTVEAMSRILDQRFPDASILADELFCAHPILSPLSEPWLSLSLINSRVAQILHDHAQYEQQQEILTQQRRAHFADLSPSELIAASVDIPTAHYAALALPKCVSTSDLALLLHIAQGGLREQRFVAFRGLQQLAHPAALPVLQDFFLSPAAHRGHLYGAAVHAITALPASTTLELARTWFDSPTSSLHHVALQILSAHATSVDIPRLRAVLLPSLYRDTRDSNECYQQCTILQTLARFPESGPYPEAEILFNEANYSRARTYAAQLLAASNPNHFSQHLALECLWDCEDDVRLSGCSYVNLSLPAAHARVEALSHDPYEKLRHTAKNRLIQHDINPIS